MNPICRRALGSVSNVCPEHCIVIHNVVYDVCNFDHPGGRVLLNLCGGMDATELFEMSHVNHKRAHLALKALPVVGHTELPERHDFTRYRDLRTRVLRIFPTHASRAASNATHMRVIGCAMFALFIHASLVTHTEYLTMHWAFLCLLSSVFNTILGAYGHNGLHRLEPHALGLDWNGLSSFEWLSEHVVSHHPFVNTENDHDSLSMEPILAWLPSRTAVCGHAQTSWMRHVVYTFSELIVSLQGTCVHATRWRAMEYGAPWWMCIAPLLFILRIASYYFFAPPLQATLTLLATMTPAGYAFATLAHFSHDNVTEGTHSKPCMVAQQLSNTRDIEPYGLTGETTLFLDRQCAHHLFPTVDHRQFSRAFLLKMRKMQ